MRVLQPTATQLSPSELLQTLEDLRNNVVSKGRQQLTHRWSGEITREEFRSSALNLAYYLALRQHDLRHLQLQLMPLGLSSLGRSESRVLEALDNLIATLRTLSYLAPRDTNASPEGFFHGDDLLDLETERCTRRRARQPADADHGHVSHPRR